VKALLAVALVALAAAGCGGGSTGATAPRGSFAVTIRVLKHGGQVIALVPVTIDGRGPYTFALDTGASQSLVDSQVARQLRAAPTGDSHRVAGISTVTEARTIELSHWRVGRVRLPATTVVEENLPFGDADGGVQGLLGSDMLSRFDVVTIDWANGLLKLRR
jgi:hypothetical protein